MLNIYKKVKISNELSKWIEILNYYKPYHIDLYIKWQNDKKYLLHFTIYYDWLQ